MLWVIYTIVMIWESVNDILPSSILRLVGLWWNEKKILSNTYLSIKLRISLYIVFLLLLLFFFLSSPLSSFVVSTMCIHWYMLSEMVISSSFRLFPFTNQSCLFFVYSSTFAQVHTVATMHDPNWYDKWKKKYLNSNESNKIKMCISIHFYFVAAVSVFVWCILFMIFLFLETTRTYNGILINSKHVVFHSISLFLFFVVFCRSIDQIIGRI